MSVTIKPINSRFKRLINDFTNQWIAIGDPVPMVCFNGEIGLTCSPINNLKKVSNFRLNEVDKL